MSTNDRPVRLYLDDVRDPPGDGWTIARTAEQARAIMLAGPVAFASLDHDLGICERCTPGALSPGGIMVIASLDGVCAKGCQCACHATGYNFALWMAETGRWPLERPVCHSANPVGRERIEGVIARYYQRPTHHATAHPAGTGACPEDEPCDECAAAYAEADADADARDNEEESETTQ